MSKSLGAATRRQLEPDMQQMLQSALQGAVNSAIQNLRKELSTMSSTLSSGQEQLRAELSSVQEQLRAELSSVQEQLRAERDQSALRDVGIKELSSKLTRMEGQMDTQLRGLRGRMSDLDSSQRTAHLVGRYVAPPYASDLANTGAAFGEREKDRAPISPSAQ